MIQREAKYYTTGYDGVNPCESPFYLRSLVFDGENGDYNNFLINEFNQYIESKEELNKIRLDYSEGMRKQYPKKIVIINASHDDLPTSYETARVFEEYILKNKLSINVSVVNSHESLIEKINEDDETIIVSQCVDKKVYNIELAKELKKKGVVAIPGEITAPGSVFSDKDSTYKLLSDDGKDWGEVARYEKVSVENKEVHQVVCEIFDAVDKLSGELGDNVFFVKPHEGGGGLGGFRITKTVDGYIIPDLSKVTGDSSEIHPTFVDIDTEDKTKLVELLWIYRLFAKNDAMKKNYIKVDLKIDDLDDETAINILKKYIVDSEEHRHKKLSEMVLSKEEAQKKVSDAIKIFEKKFNKRYTPLVNEHIDFGMWGLRAHYRLTKNGPKLETMYHRIFQLGFTKEGIGYLGADNISNKQTGDLEITRLGPINEIMVSSIGGKDKLFETLHKGAKAVVLLTNLLSDEEKDKVPLRVQLDLAAVSKRIGEGNADTSRGLCLASRWDNFVNNAEDWLEDIFKYYSWRRNSKVNGDL